MLGRGYPTAVEGGSAVRLRGEVSAAAPEDMPMVFLVFVPIPCTMPRPIGRMRAAPP